MEYKGLVFFDLDGTLLNEKSTLDEDVKLAVHQLRDNGYLPIIASGRAPFEIEIITAGTGINSYVSLNGQVVCVDGKTIYASEMSVENAAKMTTYSKEKGHALAYYTKNEYKINFISETAEMLYEYDHAPIPPVDPDFYKKEAIYFLYLFTKEENLDSEYFETFKDIFDFFRDSPLSLAIVNKGNSKSSGIDKILTYTDSSHIPTFAFGDGGNDLPMFEKVDTAIAMGNASDAVKAAADYITDSNTEGGIINGLKHFGLL